MKSNPEFSIIVPIYNEEKILDVFFHQFNDELRLKYNFELIVSDGGSIDKSVEIASEFTDKIVVHKRNRRQSISEGRNKGADLANSEILIFLNCDTKIENIETFFEYLISFKNSEEYRNHSAVAVNVFAFPDQQEVKDKIFYGFLNFYFKLLNNIGIGMGRGECQIVRKDIFDSVSGYNENIFAGEDFDLYRRIKKIGKILYSDKIIIYESPRRFKQKGYIRTIALWFINSIFVLLFNKSFSKDWEAVR